MRKIDTMTDEEKRNYWAEKKRSYRANRIRTNEELLRQRKTTTKAWIKFKEKINVDKYANLRKLPDWKRKILES